MAQTGYTPIQLYYSSTASATPSTGNLSSGELAINITDGKLFYKDNGGAIQVIGTKGGVGTSSPGQVLYNSSGLVAGDSDLTFDGTTLTAGGLAGPFNGTVGATTASSGAFTTLSASSTVSGTGFSAYLASPPAIGGTAPAAGTFTTVKAIAAATQDAVRLQGRAGGSSSYVATITPTTLTASRTVTLPNADINFVTGLPIDNGGTGQTTASAAFNALSPITSTGDLIIGNGSNSATRLPIGTTAGYVLTTNGTTASWQPSTGGVTSFTTSLSGLTPNSATGGAITLAGTLGATSGGTSQSTYAAGDLLYASGVNTLSKLAIGGTTGYVLTVSAGGLPVWSPAAGAGVTSISFGSTGLTPSTATSGAVSVAGTLAVANGGTGQTTTTAAFDALAPSQTGNSGKYLTTNGSTTSWATVSGGGSPAGADTQVQYNSGGTSFGASSAFTFTSGTGVVTATGFSGALNGTVGAATPTTGVFTTATARSTAVQDSVILQGRAGGTNSYGVTLTPTTLTASRTLTLPDASGTILQTGTTVTVGQGGTGATTLTGVLKGNGASAFTAATAGTDYSAGTSALATGIVKSTTSTGALSIAVANTDYQSPITLTTSGSSGAATFVGNTLNIPVYTGGGSSGPILESQIVISQNYTLTSNTNGFSVGPVSVATGYAVTVPTSQAWVVAVY